MENKPNSEYRLLNGSHIHHSAKLRADFKIGSFCKIEAGVEIGNGVELADHVTIKENCKIGNNVWIKEFTAIFAGTDIGNDVMIRTHCFICEDAKIGNKVEFGNYVDMVNHPRMARFNPKQEDIKRPSYIGYGSRIGPQTLIMPDSGIGDNVIITARSVVTGEIPSMEMWGGNPAKFIRKLKPEWIID